MDLFFDAYDVTLIFVHKIRQLLNSSQKFFVLGVFGLTFANFAHIFLLRFVLLLQDIKIGIDSIKSDRLATQQFVEIGPLRLELSLIHISEPTRPY